jgi:hypothetical protein
LQSLHLSLPSARISGLCHHTQQSMIFKNSGWVSGRSLSLFKAGWMKMNPDQETLLYGSSTIGFEDIPVWITQKLYRFRFLSAVYKGSFFPASIMLVFVFLMSAILTGVRCNLNVVLIYISCIYLPLVLLLLRNVCSFAYLFICLFNHCWGWI